MNDRPSLEVLLASIYYLMTRHARREDATVANAIAEHFDILASHPHCQSGILSRAGERLAMQWREHLLTDKYAADSYDICTPLQDVRKVH